MDRRYDFDWLRAFGAVLVVVAHSAGLFSSWAPSFGNIERSKLVSELLWNLNLWLMPLFMLVAGASVWYTLRKRSNRQFLRERLLHLGLPFVVLTLGFGIPMAFYSQTSTGQFSGSLREFYLHFFDIFPAGTFHLWFVAYLMIYALLTLPLFRLLRSNAGQRLMDRLARVCQFPGGLYIFAVPLLLVQLTLSGLSMPQSHLNAPPNEWTRFVMLLLVFTYGYVLISDPRLQAAIARQWPLASTLALATSAFMFAFAWQDNLSMRDLPADYSWQYVAFWTVFALSTWSWLLAWLGLGQRFLNVNPPLLKSVAATSYPLYLLHPFFTLPGILLVSQWQVNAFVGLFAVTAIALGGTLAAAAVLKQWSVARFFLGLKPELPRATPLPTIAMQIDAIPC